MQKAPQIITLRVACENIRLLSEHRVSELLLKLSPPQQMYVPYDEVRRCLTWCIERCIREMYCLPIFGPNMDPYHRVYLQVKSMLEIQITGSMGFDFFSAMVEPDLAGIIYYDNYMELVIKNANPHNEGH